MKFFHAPDYIEFLQRVSPANQRDMAMDLTKCRSSRYVHVVDCGEVCGLIDVWWIVVNGLQSTSARRAIQIVPCLTASLTFAKSTREEL